MDGSYKTYFCLTAEGHPQVAYPGWLSYIYSLGGNGTEIDVHIKKLNKKLVEPFLVKRRELKEISRDSRHNAGNTHKQNAIQNDINLNDEMEKRLNSGEDYFEVLIIVTLAAATIRALRELVNEMEETLSTTMYIKIEKCYANKREYFMGTLPLAEIPNSLFARNKRNYLTSSLESLYMFTSHDFYDPTGYFLGELPNKAIASVNHFNTNRYSNANISIFGMSGSGKTYSTQIIGKGLRIAGQRVFFICPIKAHEYLRGCKGLDGTYIQLSPGSKHRINICEIRPAVSIDKNVLEDTGVAESSLLTQKITFLLTWLNIQVYKSPMTEDEIDMAETVLTGLYNDFGFTLDNSSVFDEKGHIRRSPIISDIYDRFEEYPTLQRINKAIRKYVDGTCSNMNGETNVDLSNKYIIFDVDKRNMPETLLPSFILIACHCVQQLIMESRMTLDTVFIDEIWNIIKHTIAGELIIEMVKVIRGYGGSIVPITQDITDYLNSEVGQTILGNTAIKLIMYMEPTQCKKLAHELNLTSDDVKTITSFRSGQAMLLTSKEKVLINIIPSEQEDRDFTTDPNMIRYYAEMEAAQTSGSIN